MITPRQCSRASRWLSWEFKRAFTLVELMVSMVLLLILAAVVFSITNATAKVWKTTSTKIDSFQGARVAFESMTRNISQATLNTYWDYFDAANVVVSGTAGVIDHYGRNSELHFISGPATTLTTTASKSYSGVTPADRPTHSVFFIAPTGYSSPPVVAGDSNFQRLDNILNALGYYVEFNDDTLSRPAFLRNITTNVRHRYRLMELVQSSEKLGVYDPKAADNNAWFNKAIAAGDVRPIAENIIALIIQPKRSAADLPVLSADYSYDSRTTDQTKKVQRHQLPALIQVTMVALDEASASSLAMKTGATAPKLVTGGLFSSATNISETDNPDLDALIASLNTQHLSYRVFTTTVLIRGAKWSED